MKNYTNTKMFVYLVNRYGNKSTYWYRVFEDENGKQFIKHDGRMVALEEFKVHLIGNL